MIGIVGIVGIVFIEHFYLKYLIILCITIILPLNEAKQIIKLRLQGMMSREIADALDLSVAEVESTLVEVGFDID